MQTVVRRAELVFRRLFFDGIRRICDCARTAQVHVGLNHSLLTIRFADGLFGAFRHTL